MFNSLVTLIALLCLCRASFYDLIKDSIEEEVSNYPSWKDEFTPHTSKEKVQRFFAIGDFGDLKRKENIELMTDIMSGLAAQKKYDFIATLGDNFYPNGIESMSNLDVPNEIMSYFDKENIRDKRIFPIVGNHDCYNNYNNQVLYSDYNDQWEMESDYYELKFALKDDPSKYLVMLMTNTCLLSCQHSYVEESEGGSDCDLMNVEIGDPIIDVHYQWLEKKLKEYSNSEEIAWLGFIGHHPPIREASLKNDLLPMLQKYKVDFALVGHKHQFEYANIGYDEGIRFPNSDRGPIIDDCDKKTKERMNTDSRDHYFKKGDVLHQFMIGGSGRKLRKICPQKDQDGHVYIQNVQNNGLATIEVDSKHFHVRYHNDENLDPFFSVTINRE